MIKPIGNNVVLIRDINEDKIGSIFIPKSAKDIHFTGTVKLVGPGKKDEDGNRHAIPLKPGDKVFFKQYEGIELFLSEVSHLVIDADFIELVIFEE